MASDKVYLPVDLLHNFMIDVFVASGVPRPDAAICADVLIAADLRGIESHGIQRLKMYTDRIKIGIQQPVTNFEVVREGPTTALIDGHHGMGHVIGYRAMEMAIQKARQYGMGSVAVRNSTHFGIDGYYPLMAVREGMVGMAFTNARPSIAPTFGVQPMLGTNPIAFAAPTDEDCPFIFDAATSIIQRGKVEVYARVQKPLQAGWVTDQQGDYALDPVAVLKNLSADTNALLPLGGAGEELGGHKGYGLATMVEVLSASFQAGSFLHALSGVGPDGKPRPLQLGHFFMAINIESFLPIEEFKRTTGEIVRGLRASRKAPGHDRIYTAGEKEYELEKLVREQGIPVVPDLQKDIQFLRQEFQLTSYEFPF